MKSYGFCLFVLLSTNAAVPAQSPLAKESDENLDKQVKVLEKQIELLQDQIDKLRQQQAPLLAEQANRAAKRWGDEASTHFAKAEIQGTLRKAKKADIVLFGFSGAVVSSWQVVVNGRALAVCIPEKDKELQAAAEKLLNQKVVITGSVCYQQQPEPPFLLSTSYGSYGPPPGYRPPPTYLFVVSAASLKPATLTPSNADERKIQKGVTGLPLHGHRILGLRRLPVGIQALRLLCDAVGLVLLPLPADVHAPHL